MATLKTLFFLHTNIFARFGSPAISRQLTAVAPSFVMSRYVCAFVLCMWFSATDASTCEDGSSSCEVGSKTSSLLSRKSEVIMKSVQTSETTFGDFIAEFVNNASNDNGTNISWQRVNESVQNLATWMHAKARTTNRILKHDACNFKPVQVVDVMAEDANATNAIPNPEGRVQRVAIHCGCSKGINIVGVAIRFP